MLNDYWRYNIFSLILGGPPVYFIAINFHVLLKGAGLAYLVDEKPGENKLPKDHSQYDYNRKENPEDLK
ncbi:MAG: hypothetical protein ACREAE_04265 [Nitrosopumilaceae archaeon]